LGWLEPLKAESLEDLRRRYVEEVLNRAFERVLGKRLASSESPALVGTTSKDVAVIADAVNDALDTEIDVGLLTDPDLDVEAVAASIAASTSESPVCPTQQEDDAGCKRKELLDDDEEVVRAAGPPRWLFDVLQAVGVVVAAVLTAAPLVPAYYYGLHAQWRERKITYDPLTGDSVKVHVRRGFKPWHEIDPRSLKYSWALVRIRAGDGENDDVFTLGLAASLTILIFSLTLTLVAVVVKWLVLGRLRPGKVDRRSWVFLRVWFVDVVLNQHFQWCGQFLTDTLVMTAVYKALGAKVAWTACLPHLKRDHDLITVGPGASLPEARLLPRYFATPTTLAFAAVDVGADAKVEHNAVVMAGCVLGKNAELKKRAVALPGTTLAEGRSYAGMPARIVGGEEKTTKEDTKGGEEGDEEETRSCCCCCCCWEDSDSDSPTPGTLWWWCFEVGKLAAMVLLFFVTFFAVSTAVVLCYDAINFRNWKFRYHALLYWYLLYWQFCVLALVAAILLKWTLLGRVRPGTPRTTSLRFRAYVVDWWYFKICMYFTMPLLFGVGEWPTLLWMALGAKVSSTRVHGITPWTVPASGADLITIGEGTVLSDMRLNPLSSSSSSSRRKTYERIVIGERVWCGLFSRVEAGAVIGDGASVAQNATVAPKEVIPPETARLPGDYALLPLPKKEILKKKEEFQRRRSPTQPFALVLRVVLLACYFGAMIPSFEIAAFAFYGSPSFYRRKKYLFGFDAETGDKWTPPVPRWVAVLLVGPVFVFVTLPCFAVVTRLFVMCGGNYGPLVPSKKNKLEDHEVSPWYFLLYRQALHFQYQVNLWAISFVGGTELANVYYRFHGATVRPGAFVNTALVIDVPFVTVGRNAVLDDDSLVMGHYYTPAHSLICAPVSLGADAILHPFSSARAGDTIPDNCHLGPGTHIDNNLPRRAKKNLQEKGRDVFLLGNAPPRVIPGGLSSAST